MKKKSSKLQKNKKSSKEQLNTIGYKLRDIFTAHGVFIMFLIAGASAVQIGTATFHDPGAAERIVAGLAEAVAFLGAKHIGEIVGTLRSNASR